MLLSSLRPFFLLHPFFFFVPFFFFSSILLLLLHSSSSSFCFHLVRRISRTSYAGEPPVSGVRCTASGLAVTRMFGKLTAFGMLSSPPRDRAGVTGSKQNQMTKMMARNPLPHVSNLLSFFFCFLTKNSPGGPRKGTVTAAVEGLEGDGVSCVRTMTSRITLVSMVERDTGCTPACATRCCSELALGPPPAASPGRVGLSAGATTRWKNRSSLASSRCNQTTRKEEEE